MARSGSGSGGKSTNLHASAHRSSSDRVAALDIFDASGALLESKTIYATTPAAT